MNLYLNESQARKRFKDLLGQANHLIITALVGLDGVEKGLITDSPTELHAAWSPLNPKASARRARRLILDMVLVRAVDSVDTYIRTARRSPGILQNQTLRNEIDAAGRSVMLKVNALEARYSNADPVVFALVTVMIAWRNKSAHEEAEANIDQRHTKVLMDNADVIFANYHNLEIERLLSGFEKGDPTFKECASLIHAAHQFVELVEKRLFRDLDAEQYLKDIIWNAPSSLDSNDAKSYRKERIQSVWGQDESDRMRVAVRHLRSFGITSERRYEGAIFPSALIERLCSMTPSQVYDWADPTA